jgi:hypothetical protein
MDKELSRTDLRRLKLNCLKALKNDSCEDCGYSDRFDILEFHHIVPRYLSGRPSWTVVRDWAWPQLREEYERECALLCPNCHKARHMNMDAESRDADADDWMNYNYEHMTAQDMLNKLEE